MDKKVAGNKKGAATTGTSVERKPRSVSKGDDKKAGHSPAKSATRKPAGGASPSGKGKVASKSKERSKSKGGKASASGKLRAGSAKKGAAAKKE